MTTTAVEDVFRALSDSTRRRVPERLSQGPASVSDLARPFEMALPSFVQHLGFLEGCGLVRSRKRGRVRTYDIASENLRPAEDLLAGTRAAWETRLDRLDSYVLQLQEQSKEA
jgi:DNA-binding transcriptional ArsR family regulator